jgi:tRNA (mo5U34)-methyltransferase
VQEWMRVNVTEQLERLGPWYHSIDLGKGVHTPGRSRVDAKFKEIAGQLPRSLSGLRVLDLGCNAGGIAVQFAQRGAAVVGVEASPFYYRQACWVRDQLDVDVDYRNITIYDVGGLDGTFDIVVFLGLFYHLRYPQLALDILAKKCEGTLIMNTPIVQSTAPVMELRLPQDSHDLGQAREPQFNWWFPSLPALRTMLAVAGFSDIVEFNLRKKPFVSSSKHANNASAFPTGSVYLRATGHGTGTVPAAMSSA